MIRLGSLRNARRAANCPRPSASAKGFEETRYGQDTAKARSMPKWRRKWLESPASSRRSIRAAVRRRGPAPLRRSRRRYRGDAEMFALMHAMRVRMMTAPAFTGEKVIAAILFEATMDGEAKGLPVPTYLWKERGVVPLLKVDKALPPRRTASA